MSARRLAVLVDHLPDDAMSVRLARAELERDQPASGGARDQERQQQQPDIRRGPRVLEDVPVVPLRKAMQFVQANGDEFASQFCGQSAN